MVFWESSSGTEQGNVDVLGVAAQPVSLLHLASCIPIYSEEHPTDVHQMFSCRNGVIGIFQDSRVHFWSPILSPRKILDFREKK